MAKRKYAYTGLERMYLGRRLKQILLVSDIPYAEKGVKGGWIEHEGNLSHEGTCWLCDSSVAFGDAEITGSAYIVNGSVIEGRVKEYAVASNAHIAPGATIKGLAKISDRQVPQHATFDGNCVIDKYSLYTHLTSPSGDASCTIYLEDTLMQRLIFSFTFDGEPVTHFEHHVKDQVASPTHPATKKHVEFIDHAYRSGLELRDKIRFLMYTS